MISLCFLIGIAEACPVGMIDLSYEGERDTPAGEATEDG